MLESGMPLLAALDAASEAAGDAEMTRRLVAVRSLVARGLSLTKSLTAERALTGLAIQLIGVGESSGQLDQMTSQAGQILAERAQRQLRAVVSILEPALVISLGLVVAIIAAALMQAVYSVRPM
jgi:type II secretory pathway component PulF